MRTDDGRIARLQGAHHLAGIVHGKRRLRHERQVVLIGWIERRDIRDRLKQGRCAFGELAHGADHLRVARMADQQDVPSALVMARASRCTLVTSGQVASMAKSRRSNAAAGTDFGTP